MFRRNKDNKKLYKLLFFSILLFSLILGYKKTYVGIYINKSANQIFANCIDTIDKSLNFLQEKINSIKLNSTLYKENLTLKTSLRTLNDKLEQSQLEMNELMHLKNELKYYSPIKNTFITTRIFSITPGPYVREALIGAGSNVGIEKGDIVLYNQMLIGRVIEIYNSSSKVLLIFDSRSKISAITENTRKKILLEGNNTEKLIVKYLPETEKIEHQEFVETSNYCSLFPSCIKIGKINSKNMNSPYVSVPYRIKDINYVHVIRNISNIPNF